MLSHKDRVLKAVGHEEPDLVPIDSWFTSPVLRRLCEFFGARDEDELRVKLDLDVITLQIHVTEGTFRKIIHEDELGVSILNPVQPLCMDVVELREKYGDKLCLWGTLDTQYLLPFGSRRDVELEVLNRIKTLGRGGGLILAPVHTVLPDVPLENYLTFVKAAKKYGKYPIPS